jgi:nucleoside-triphosphatase
MRKAWSTPMGMTVLLTGRPGVGKTTLVRKWIAAHQGHCGGFFTRELRESGARVGFEIVTLDGQRALLAHVQRRGVPRVGKYGVYVEHVETVAVPAIERAVLVADYVIIDEIGKMELLCDAFQAAVLKAVDSPKTVLGTVMQRGNRWVDELKSRSNVVTVVVTMQNRERLLDQLTEFLVGGGAFPESDNWYDG